MSRTPDFDKPLPDCEGPKLHPFKHRKAAIKFHRLLSDTDMPQAGGDSHVFEVSIRSKVYALKVVRPQAAKPSIRAFLTLPRCHSLSSMTIRMTEVICL